MRLEPAPDMTDVARARTGVGIPQALR
jgi:hypothetical protein